MNRSVARDQSTRGSMQPTVPRRKCCFKIKNKNKVNCFAVWIVVARLFAQRQSCDFISRSAPSVLVWVFSPTLFTRLIANDNNAKGVYKATKMKQTELN